MTTAPTQTTVDCTTTSIEGVVTRTPLPNPDNKPYLMRKASYAALFPRLTFRISASGKVSEMNLKQLVMSGLIRADEYRRDYLWHYKAEVSFDMTSMPPKPFLSTSSTVTGKEPDPNRRHSFNFFPPGRTDDFLRRPDVIIVKNRAVCWPGLAGPDHEGVLHPDNLERVVEVKFPEDEFSESQEQAYKEIAGGADRLSVLVIHDCRDEDDRKRDEQYNKVHQWTADRNPLRWPSLLPTKNPDTQPRPAPTPVPAYGPEPTPRPAHVESWTQQVQTVIDGLMEHGAQGVRQLSQEVQPHLEEAAKWLSAKGDWVRNESQKAWEWVSETGAEVLRWTDEQLRAAWSEIQHHTDLSLDILREIDWMQVLIELGIAATTVVVIVAVSYAAITLTIPAALVAILVLIIRLAQLSWALLATILGGAAATATLTAG